MELNELHNHEKKENIQGLLEKENKRKDEESLCSKNRFGSCFFRGNPRK